MVNGHGLGLGARECDITNAFETLRIDNAKQMCLGVLSLGSAFYVVILVYRIDTPPSTLVGSII